MNSEGSRRKPDTPVCDFVRNYREQGWLRLHMPGHKGRGALEALDITEIRGAEPLYSGGGILRESEEIAAELFGADRTVYSAEGSSLCIHAMLFLAKMRAEQRGEKALILAGRNAHRSFLSAAALLGLEVAWLRGENLLTCRPDGITLERALAELKEKPAAVYLTSPDYLGNRADISALSRVCRSRGIPLLVDNAHGAYLRFLPRDEHPLTLGADLTCDSAHKTLPVLTGGAYLHISREADPFWRGQADRAMALFASTSPSWLILQSLDRCNAELRNGYREKLARLAEETDRLKERLRDQGWEIMDGERIRITICPRSFGYTGDGLHNLLRERKVECEFSDPDYLVMMLTPETGKDGLEKLEKALREIPRRPPLPEERPPMPEPDQVMPFGEALLAPAEKVAAEKSAGRILADPCVSCPPAVPLLISGERIGEEAVRCFRYYGISDVWCVCRSFDFSGGI